MKLYIRLPLLIVLFFVAELVQGENVSKGSFSCDNWDKARKIERQVIIPEFPDKVFNIEKYGAVGDGKTKNTKAINTAIRECSSKGGGVVLVPAGIFMTGAIHFENNVKLNISKGGKLLFSSNPKDYLPVVETSWEGIRCWNYSPLIYAHGKKNIAITGEGELDGGATAENWWSWIPLQRKDNARPLLDRYNASRTPLKERIMGEGKYLRPHFIQFYKCKNILIEGVTIKDSPFWMIHPLMSENITVRGVSLISHGPNTDGCDPESCNGVVIKNCIFNTGDDCIALKSGRNEDGRALGKPIENVVIKGCNMKDGHGGIVMGSEVSGGVKNVYAEDCKMNSPNLGRAVRIKTSSQRGGVIEDVYIRNIEVGEVSGAVIRINCEYGKPGKYFPLVHDVYISDIKAQKANYGILMRGLPGNSCVEDIHISDCKFNGTKIPVKIEYAKRIKFDNVYINDKKLSGEFSEAK